MAANITDHEFAPSELLDGAPQHPEPMTDADHLAVFGWAWDDPARVGVEA